MAGWLGLPWHLLVVLAVLRGCDYTKRLPMRGALLRCGLVDPSIALPKAADSQCDGL